MIVSSGNLFRSHPSACHVAIILDRIDIADELERGLMSRLVQLVRLESTGKRYALVAMFAEVILCILGDANHSCFYVL